MKNVTITGYGGDTTSIGSDDFVDQSDEMEWALVVLW